jgi:hypothetical protein
MLMRRMLACGRWAGAGRGVTRQGFPAAADTRSLAEALGIEVGGSVRDPRDHAGLIRGWRLALDVEILRLHRTAVVAGLAAVERAMTDDADPEHVLSVWKEIVDVAVTGSTPLAPGDGSAPELEEFSRPWGPRALGDLYRADGPVDLGDLIDKLVTDYHGPGADEMLAVLAGVAVRAGLLVGTEAGAVAVTVPTDIDTEMVRAASDLPGEPVWAVVPVPGTTVELTPLGRYLVRLNLLAEGTHAPLLEPAT